MTPAALAAALALLAAPGSTSADGPVQGSLWLNGGGVAVTLISRGQTLDLPLGATIPIPGGPTLTFEATYFQWSCTSGATCNVSQERGGFLTAGFHVDTEGRGPLNGFFIAPKLQLSGFQRTVPQFPSYDGWSFAAELGLDLGYQWRLGNFYFALMIGASGGIATHAPSGLYGLLVEWNGSSTNAASLTPQTPAYVFGINGNLARIGFTF